MSWKQEKTMECPSCKEISFEHTDTLTGNGKRTLEFHCSCGELGYFDEPIKRQGFDSWVQQMGGCDFIDELGKVEGMRIAFLAGISAQQDIEIARLDKDISLLKRQAE